MVKGEMSHPGVLRALISMANNPIPNVLNTLIIICSEQSDRPATSSSMLIDDLGLDSMDLVTMCIAIEENYPDVGPLDYVPERMQTVGDLADYVCELLNSKATTGV